MLERADHPERIEYVLAVHESRWLDYKAYPPIDSPVHVVDAGWHSIKEVRNTGADANIAQANAAAAASTGKLLVGVMDDIVPPEHWDTLLLDAIAAKDLPRPELLKPGMVDWQPDLDTELILHCSTGSPSDKDLMNAGAMTRKRYERYGYLCHPDFESMYADNWFTFEARRDEAAGLCKIITRMDILFEHRHPIFGKGEPDEIYALQNRELAYREGAAIFHQKMTGQQVIVLCLPGETFRNEWNATTFQTIMNLSHRYIVSPHWCYTTNVYCTRIELARSALAFKPKADYIVWLDDDNLATADQIHLLIQDLEENPDLGGVVGWCWCDHNQADEHKPQTWVVSCGRQKDDMLCSRFTPEDFQKAAKGNSLITSDDVAPDAFWSGFPLVVMRRSTLETLGWEAFKPLILPVKFGFTGEDTAFFKNAHEAGIKFAVDMRVQVPHAKWRAIQPALPESAKEAAELSYAATAET